MDIGAEPSISDQEIVRLEFRMQLDRLGHIVGSQRCGQHLGNHARAGVQQHQPVRRGKAAAYFLPARLAEVGLQFGRIGHRKARSIDMEYAVTEPA